MLTAFQSLLPVFALIALGAGLRRLSLLSDEQWRGMEDLVYYVCFPALIVYTLAIADFSGIPVIAMAAAMAAAILTMAVALFALRKPMDALLGIDGPAFTSVFQGSTRWNTYVALAVIGSLYGAAGLSLAAIGVAVMIPLVNTLSVIVLLTCAGHTQPDGRQIARGLYTNPLIVACLVGLAINLSGIPLYAPLVEATDILGRATLGLGLLTVGAGLRLAQGARLEPAVIVSSTARLIGMPALMFVYCWMLGVTGLALTVAMLCASVPTAVASFVLARKLGGDAPLMARIITVQVLAAMATMPVILALLPTN